MEQRPEPKIIILDVWRQVRVLENALKTCQLIAYKDQTVAAIVIAACDSDMCWSNLFEVVAELKHSQREYLPESALNKLAMAVGDLGMAIIEQLQRMWLYDEGRILPYMFNGYCNGSIVLKSNGALRYVYRACLEDRRE